MPKCRIETNRCLANGDDVDGQKSVLSWYPPIYLLAAGFGFPLGSGSGNARDYESSREAQLWLCLLP